MDTDTCLNIVFKSKSREQWLETVALYQSYPYSTLNEVHFSFENISVKDLTPLHISSFACLIEHFSKCGVKVYIPSHTNELGEYLLFSLKFKEYWSGKRNFSVASDQDVLNLWHISESEKEFYGIRVEEYLKKGSLANKDLSSLKQSILEACYNSLDHANADGNAFSFIKYDSENLFLEIAVCDFGIGIPNSVRKICPDLSDEQCLIKAMDVNFSTKSKPYNAGKGLDIIRASVTKGSYFYLISDRAFLLSSDDSTRTGNLNFSFPGTLLVYEIDLSLCDDRDDELLDGIQLL